MCGITGIGIYRTWKIITEKIDDALNCLENVDRMPEEYTLINMLLSAMHVCLLLTISPTGFQPMTDASGRYTLIFNGEFFNLRNTEILCCQKGIHLKSESDTEVLLYLYILEGTRCLERINGFFAFAIHDKQRDTVFIALFDRMGIKPLLYYQDENQFLFASEMKAMIALEHSQRVGSCFHAVFIFNWIIFRDRLPSSKVFSNWNQDIISTWIFVILKRIPNNATTLFHYRRQINPHTRLRWATSNSRPDSDNFLMNPLPEGWSQMFLSNILSGE